MRHEQGACAEAGLGVRGLGEACSPLHMLPCVCLTSAQARYVPHVLRMARGPVLLGSRLEPTHVPAPATAVSPAPETLHRC